jgi:hypothetical protein
VLIERHPKIATKLLIGLGARVADRPRGLDEQLQTYATVTGDLQAEVRRLRGSTPIRPRAFDRSTLTGGTRSRCEAAAERPARST